MKRRTAVAVRAAVTSSTTARSESSVAPRLPGQPLDIARAIAEELRARQGETLDAKERIKRKLKGLHPMD